MKAKQERKKNIDQQMQDLLHISVSVNENLQFLKRFPAKNEQLIKELEDKFIEYYKSAVQLIRDQSGRCENMEEETPLVFIIEEVTGVRRNDDFFRNK